MLVNGGLTIYHKDYDDKLRLEKWIRFNYQNVWLYGGKGASSNKGYDQANNVQVRIPYELNEGLNIKDFSIGDIIVQGILPTDIDTQQDLADYDIYNITSINDNKFGSEPHIHLGGE